MDFEDVPEIVGGCVLTMLFSVVVIALLTLGIKFAIGFYGPIIRFVWGLW